MLCFKRTLLPSHYSSSQYPSSSKTTNNIVCQTKTSENLGNLGFLANFLNNVGLNADAPHSTNVYYTTIAEEEYLFMIQAQAANKTPIVTVKLNATPISKTVDTSASLDIIDELTVDRLKHGVSLQHSTTRSFAYGASTQLHILGKFAATLESNQTCHTTIVHVTKGQYGCLLGYKSAKALGLIQLHINHVEAKDK